MRWLSVGFLSPSPRLLKKSRRYFGAQRHKIAHTLKDKLIIKERWESKLGRKRIDQRDERMPKINACFFKSRPINVKIIFLKTGPA
jgi:hypothetical protein